MTDREIKNLVECYDCANSFCDGSCKIDHWCNLYVKRGLKNYDDRDFNENGNLPETEEENKKRLEDDYFLYHNDVIQ